jgi:hypothetical protein
MAFITSGTTVLSFATYDDVIDRDARVTQENEGLTVDIIEDLLIRSTERILSLLRSTNWWQEYYLKQSGASYRTSGDIPQPEAEKVLTRKNDFTDLCVYHCLYEYVFPKIADFSDENNAERRKIGYYQQKFNSLFDELIKAGDWYDYDDDASVESSEMDPGIVSRRRVR